MRISYFSEQQIIGKIREHWVGIKTAKIDRKHGVSDAAFLKYSARYGGITVSDAKRLITRRMQSLTDFPASK